MTGTEVIATYERMLEYLREMHAAAGRSDWDAVAALEGECRGVTRRLMENETGTPLTAGEAARKATLIREALVLDAAIRELVEPWLRQLDAFLSSRQLERRVQNAYGVPHAR